MSEAIGNLRVIDLSRVLGGPFCTQVLGDHGADVIKIEPPGGDETRGWGPPFRDDTASYFLGINRNKRAMALDLRSEAGRAILLELLEDTDILVENFKTGTMEAWGLGYEEFLSKRFPKLIHCRITGFGADGPMGGLPGYDAVVQAMAGLMSVNGERDGPPLRVGLPVVDMVTGLNAVIGILLAINARTITGRGQLVEAALFDSGLSLLHPHAANYFLSGKRPQRSGNAHPNIAPYELFETAAQPVFLAVGNDGQFVRLCATLGIEQLGKDERFATNRDRLENRKELHELLQKEFMKQAGAELAPRLIRAGVPCGAILNTDEALSQAHAAHREMIVEMGDYKGVASPIKLSETPASYRRKPPALSGDSREILSELGYDEKAIEDLMEKGIVQRQTG